MIGVGGGSGHDFRTSNKRNAAAFLQEQKSRRPMNAQRLPRTRAGKILFVLAFIAVLAVAALVG